MRTSRLQSRGVYKTPARADFSALLWTQRNHGYHSGTNTRQCFWFTVKSLPNYFYVSLLSLIWLQRFVLLASSAPVFLTVPHGDNSPAPVSLDLSFLPDCLGLLRSAALQCSPDLQSSLWVNSLWDLAPFLLFYELYSDSPEGRIYYWLFPVLSDEKNY